MKKTVLIVVVLAALLAATVGAASANGGPHGGYTPTTDACAGCHRTHTASGARLLIDTSTYALCMSCHGSAGTGADTNVADGFFLSTRSESTHGTANTANNAPLLGGGFSYYEGAATTSTHDVTNSVTYAWGTGTAGRGEAALLAGGAALNCASCHDPHGSSNYRILRDTVNGIPVAVAQVDEGAAKDYDTEQWGAGTSSFCAACHDAYHQTAAGQGSILDDGSYTHRIDMNWAYGGNVNPEIVGLAGSYLPLSQSSTLGLVVCMTCHLPHGTSAQMTGIADGGPLGTGNIPGDTTATDSALLRLDNRAVCEVCHQK